MTHWERVTPLGVALLPLSLLFRMLVALRRGAYRIGFFRSRRVGVPVVIVGNISAGGTGKTPLVLWLVEFLATRGFKPGIVSRGYRAENREPRVVTSTSDPTQCGDEPVLLAQRSGRPVCIGADRAAAACALLGKHRDCNVIVSDDGLQHYALARDCEIAVIDGERGLGNGLLLPAGPLREPPSRLESVDALVVNGPLHEMYLARNVFGMRIEGREFRNVLNPDHIVGPDHFQRRRIAAIAGIGNPTRFFSHLRALGLDFEAHAFPDHHTYVESELAYAAIDAIVMTEKDAVKCAAFAHENYWALRVDAVPDAALGEFVVRKISPLEATT